MMQRYLASQLRKPTGLIGKFILGALWNRRNASLNNMTFNHLELREDDRVLDVGFGGGYLIEKIIPAVRRGWVAGIDASPQIAANSQQRWRKAIQAGKAAVQCGCVEALPFPDRSFTKVCSVNSIFYWSDAQQGLLEIHRVLQAGGKVVLTHTCRRDLEKKRFAQYGVTTYADADVQHMLSMAGFKTIQTLQNQDRHRTFSCISGYKQV